MEPKAPKKCHHSKKWIKTQKSFANKFPFRVSWPTEPTSESPQPWEVRNKPLEEQLPLQKNLVPRRSIPSPGFRASDFASPSSYRPPPRPSRPQYNFWELKLLSIRFPHMMPSEAACFTGQYRVLLRQ